MKNDNQLQKDVVAELSWEPCIQSKDIAVSVKDGIVTLNGNVPTYAEKFAAESAAKRVTGVSGIAEELKVNLTNAHQRNDGDIAKAATVALAGNTSIPQEQVKVVVENGWVTLTGELEWNYQRDYAHNAVRHLIGVKGVSNDLVVKALTVSALDVRGKIETTLKRIMQRASDKITIEATDGIVRLQGKVHTWEERNDAGKAAWSAPGVSMVENNQVVSYY